MHSITQIKDIPDFLPAVPHPKFEDAEHLAILCHEIRTPLGAIVGLADLLASLECSPEKQRECADMLHDSSKMLMELLNDLLDSFKLGSGEMELEHIPFDLTKVLEEAKNIITVKAQEKGLNVYINIGRDIPVLFMGDPLRIRQILLNLLSNAIKFTNKGIISIHMNEEITSNGYSHIRITVADSGIGIGKENLSKIFNKYKQASTSVSREYGGTGLGLFISQELAYLMKGRISVESWPLIGSHFTVSLPLQKASALLVAA